MIKKHKNILLIVVDCLRADFVYGSKKAHIPTITKLKNEGYSFLNTIAAASTTTPCFASLLTGLYPFEHGVRSFAGHSLKNEVVTFPEILRENGYNTYAEVVGPLFKETGLSKGFDEYNCRSTKRGIHTEWGNDLMGKFKNYYKEPWFILFHIWSLHLPRIVINECNHEKHGHTLYGKALASIDKYLGMLVGNLDDDTIIVLTGDHGEQIAYSKFDAFCKKRVLGLFRLLKKYKITNIPFAKGMRKFHIGHDTGIYDVLVKVPLIFQNKNIIPVGRSECQVRSIDIFPTILDLIGIRNNTRIRGESVIFIMKGIVNTHRDAYMEDSGGRIPDKDEWLAGLRIDNRYKYIYFPFRQDFEEELYCLEANPAEKRNIAKRNKDLVNIFRRKSKEMKTEELVGEVIDREAREKMIKKLRSLGYI